MVEGRVTPSTRVAMLVKAHGSYRLAGLALGVDPGYLHKIQHGRAGEISEEVLAKLGLQRVVQTFYITKEK